MELINHENALCFLSLWYDRKRSRTEDRTAACVNSTMRMNTSVHGILLVSRLLYCTGLLFPCISQTMLERMATLPSKSSLICLLVCLGSLFAWGQGFRFIRLASDWLSCWGGLGISDHLGLCLPSSGIRSLRCYTRWRQCCAVKPWVLCILGKHSNWATSWAWRTALEIIYSMDDWTRTE